MEKDRRVVDLSLPRGPGTYALILSLSEPRSIVVGKLGEFEFPAGYYMYVGSAFGPGGLAGRLRRHLKQMGDSGPSVHWHIDYLRQQASMEAIWYTKVETPREHDWAALVGQMKGAQILAPRFGASDCRCPTHLFYLAERPVSATFQQLCGIHFPDDRQSTVEISGTISVKGR